MRDDGMPDEPVGRLPDEHLAGTGGLLEPRSDVDRVTGREPLSRCRVSDDHLAGVDAGAGGEANPVLLGELVVDASESLLHLERRTHGTEGVVLVDGRHAEHGHDRVADELLDGAAVVLERRLHRAEVAPHHPPQRLGIEPLSERGRAGDVREDDRHDLPRLGVASPPVELLTAGVAEPCVGVVLASAGATDHEVRPYGSGVRLHANGLGGVISGRKVMIDEPNRLALELFAPLGPTYDRYSRVFSLGQDPRWRRFLVSRIGAGPGDTIVDVATGTGAVAIELVRQTGCRVIGVDQSPEMLAVARERVARAGLGDRIRFVEAGAEQLPFADAEFDGLTFTYLLRYVRDVQETMSGARARRAPRLAPSAGSSSACHEGRRGLSGAPMSARSCRSQAGSLRRTGVASAAFWARASARSRQSGRPIGSPRSGRRPGSPQSEFAA